MRKALLMTAALGSLALASLLSTGAQAGPNLVENGGFEMNTLRRPEPSGGAERRHSRLNPGRGRFRSGFLLYKPAKAAASG